MNHPVGQYGHITESVSLDDRGRATALHYRADHSALLAHTGALRRDNPSGSGPSRQWRHVATIDPVIQLVWIRRYGADPLAPGNGRLLRRILNDPEWKYLRTSGGRL